MYLKFIIITNQPIFQLILVILVLTACSFNFSKNLEKNQDSPQWHQHQKEIYRLSQYQTHGIFAYFSGQKKVYIRFFWKQINQNNYDIFLFNLLGNTELKLNVRSGQAQIIDNKGQRYIATDAEKMIRNLTDIPIPLNNLRQWILGLPGEATEYSLDNQYRLRELNYIQNRKIWKVIYRDYNTKIIPTMPSSIELIENGQHIKLKMENWVIK